MYVSSIEFYLSATGPVHRNQASDRAAVADRDHWHFVDQLVSSSGNPQQSAPWCRFSPTGHGGATECRANVD